MPIPRENSIDSTLALLNEGYNFISRRCERLHSDAFETRIMLRRVICALGEDAAAMFYQPDRFTRRQAVPPGTLMLLQDVGSVQTLDGDAHRRRKHMFMSLMHADRLHRIMALFENHWLGRIAQWGDRADRADGGEVVLQEEAERVLCAAICEWAGVPLTDAAVEQRAREFAAMIDGAGAIGPRNWKGQLLRARTEDWARSIIAGVRAGHVEVPVDSAVHVIASHLDVNGEPLDEKTAAIELINVLRPTVAVARYVTFAALALHHHPQCREGIRSSRPGDDDYLQCFVQEVRRFYPFFPMIGGRVLQEFDWRDTHFAGDDWVLLDLYGTNHDPRIWGDPDRFRPERFSHWGRSPFNFIPQGGGDFDHGHRCAGEWMTIRLMKAAARLLVSAMDYDVPVQDLRIDMARMPAIPESRFVIRNVRPLPGFRREAELDMPVRAALREVGEAGSAVAARPD